MMRKIAPLVALLLALSLLGARGASTPASAAEQPSGCQDTGFWGACFDTLPLLHCCSAAFLGWSEIVVGDRFPVAGNMHQTEPFAPATGLKITYPSGRSVTIPVEPGGRFHGMVSFDEEGSYRISRIEAGVDRAFGDFQVAYRAELLDIPTVDSQFGPHHHYSGVTMGVVEADRPVEVRIRFTDASGEPVRSRTLAIGQGDRQYTTDSEGVAQFTYEPPGDWSGYTIERLYPGLGLLSYRTVTIDDSGVAHGLPGGDVAGYTHGGRLYLPLKEFLEKADPAGLGDQQIKWNEETRTVSVRGLNLMIDTGMVLGMGDFRADIQMRSDRTYMELDSLIRLLDRLGMASRTGDFAFRLSMAQVP